MFKIRLLILLLISIFLNSCTNNYSKQDYQKFSIAYIGGEYDGLMLKSILNNHLNSFNAIDTKSPYEIQASISHSSDLYITNIDNTSDRQKISSSLSIRIINNQEKCILLNYNNNVSQFYIYASGDKFLSNQRANKKIKKDNTEALVKNFVNKLFKTNMNCNEKQKSN